MFHRWLALIVLVAVAGCAQRPPPRLYVLSPAPVGSEASAARVEPAVAVLRVTIPDYLDRPQVVSRSNANALKIDYDSRWGEPLDRSVPRVMAANLSSYLPGVRVVTPQETRGRNPRYAYEITLDAYEANGREQVVMQGRWQLRDRRNGKVVAAGPIADQRPAGGSDTAAIVAAVNDSLTTVSRELAAATAGYVARR